MICDVMTGRFEPSEALRAMDLSALVGLTQAQARSLVEDSGGRLQAQPDGPWTADLVLNRVRAVVDDTDRIVRVIGIG